MAPASEPVGGDGREVLRLGYFANLTHATALLGAEGGMFAEWLGRDTFLDKQIFGAGPAAVESLFSGATDAAYLGPNPALNAYVRSDGEAIRVVAGAANGGSFFVTQPEIGAPLSLRGLRVASPQLGNTQDVALRTWLLAQGFRTDPQGGGDVSVVPQENAQSLETFRSGQIAGAWVPEPWASRLVLEGGGRVLVDERDLWPDGRYPSAVLVVARRYMERHPQVVERLLRAHVEVTAGIMASPAESASAVNAIIGKITGKALPGEILSRSWANLAFDHDPLVPALEVSAAHARRLGFLPAGDIAGVADLSILNRVLAGTGRPGVPE